MPIDPVILGGGVLAYVAAAGSGLHEATHSDPTATAPEGRPVGPAPADGWVWPMVVWKGYSPIVSDGAHKKSGTIREHHGADIDYKSKTLDDQPQFKPYSAERYHNTRYFCPSGLPVLAAKDGWLWSASLSPRGLQVVIDHGKPFATYYQHLKRLFVPFASGGIVTEGERKGEKRIPIKAGQVIGICGNGRDPGHDELGFNHLHFEVWRDGGPSSWVDPEPYLSRARLYKLEEVKIP